MDEEKIGEDFLISNCIMQGTDVEMIPIARRGGNNSSSVTEFGKLLLHAAAVGDTEDIKSLMMKGAPFTADIYGNSPLHKAAQNNHLDVCEMLIRAGISKDARTKVDRTPLHLAVYEGHYDIVDCLLKNGADYDCRDMLQMTPLHWAAQKGFADIATLLIRFGASTNIYNKFDLTPMDIAKQVKRQDIIDIIHSNIRDPLIATRHLQLEMTESNELPEAYISTEVLLENVDNLTDSINNVPNSLPEDTAIVEDDVNEDGDRNLSESMRYLQEHGIVMLPNDETSILSSVVEAGHSVVLTDVGKEVLNATKQEDTPVSPIKQAKPFKFISNSNGKKIITLSTDQLMSLTSNGQVLSPIKNQLIQVPKGAIIKNNNVKRIIVKKKDIVNKTVENINIVKVQPMVEIQNLRKEIAQVKQELVEKVRELEETKKKLQRKEIEAKNYKIQLEQLKNSLQNR